MFQRYKILIVIFSLAIIFVFFGNMAWNNFTYNNSLRDIQSLGVNDLNGQITEISGSSVKISANVPESLNFSQNQAAKMITKIYSVKISKDTEINLFTGQSLITTSNNIQDLRVGDPVTVFTKENIIGASEVTASKIGAFR